MCYRWKKEEAEGELCGLSHCSRGAVEAAGLLPVFELCCSGQRGLGRALSFHSNRAFEI